ncbi:PP2C family protein-serine/threonine phosphatase [Pararhodospirillum oryzae]|uniref:Cyclic nucleotide-binding domain-containing protein n=1 Tax=Pararhodospirillum oryzae TaxID=478448 RepID=A0A512HA17_9PROT|nr:SpoIIE family protein phosphatase [Pararhodospirillum oryzae]GEO82301.1 hypothetical protein ROR02_24320 [Pararhodospirillum oryzae]
MSRDRVEALQATPLFVGLSDGFLGQLADACQAIDVTAGTVLFQQGESGKDAYIILSGEARILLETPLGSSCIAVVGRGQLLGEMSALADVSRTATVISETPMALLRIHHGDLHRLILSYPDAALSILQILVHRLDNTNRPLGYLLHAANALERADLDPALLDAMIAQAGAITPFAQAFARVVRALVARRESVREMELSARLQRSILPASIPELAGVDFGALMEPARAVGGDFYDIFSLGERRAAVVVADVSGKGVPAAFFMAVTRTAMRALAHSRGEKPSDLVASVNAMIAAENTECMFVTLFLGVIDAVDGRFEWCSAGHTDGLAVLGSEVVRLKPTGPAIGIDPDARYTTREVRLSPGDSLFIYTDGVTEAMSPTEDLFGIDPLIALLQSWRGGDPRDVVKAVEHAVVAFTDGHPQADDITCLALRKL